jgi:hypothetical protein
MNPGNVDKQRSFGHYTQMAEDLAQMEALAEQRRQADAFAKHMNARNELKTILVDAAVNTFIVVAFAAFGLWALIHWLTPCETGTLCMAAVMPRPRPGWVQRIKVAMRAWRIRLQLADTEATLNWVEEDLDMLPILRRRLALRRDALLLNLADCEAEQ